MNNVIVSIGGLNFDQYIDSKGIEQVVKQVAAQINAKYSSCELAPVLLITLSGAMMFAAELSKRLDFFVEWAFIKCASYNQALCSTGVIKFKIEPTMDLTGRDVIVVEDIVDTGHTWAAIQDKLAPLNLKSLTIATMCFKKEAYLYPNLIVDYVGIEVENKFVIGYGLDYNGLGRNLNGIYILKSE